MSRNSISQKALSFLLCFALVCSIFSLDTVGVSAAQSSSTPTVLYLDSGDIEIDGANVTQNGQPVTRGARDNGYVITQEDSSTATENTISVLSGSQNITIHNINSNASGSWNAPASPITIASGASLDLTLLGDNTLTSSCGAGIDAVAKASLTVTKSSTGSLNVTGKSDPGISGGSITIDGGTVRASGSESGIGGENVTVNGGSVMATGGTMGPGIQGNLITINGGIVVARCISDEGAGIGGRYKSSVGKIRITGGIVTAIGGYASAGIGGCNGRGGTIEITGGTVHAFGGDRGAGIGGLGGSDGGTISISGGNVTATGVDSSAGIGGNWGDVYAGTITISGGSVTATGSDGAAGIGGDEGYGYDREKESYTGLGGKVTITGSHTVVTATGGEDSICDIGSGSRTGTDGVGGTLKICGDHGNLESVPVLFLGKGGTNAQCVFADCAVLGSGAAAQAGYYDGNGYRTPVFDVTYGSVSVGESEAKGYIGADSQLTERKTDVLLVTGTSSSNGISVTGGKHKIMIYNLNVSSDNAFAVGGDSSVNLALYGSNALASTGPHAGLEIASKAAAEISGIGSLTATGGSYSAGIGGEQYNSNGTLSIGSGTVTAIGGKKGAGIGGGIGGSGGSITISGGTVTATGGSDSAGIGGGSEGDGGTVNITGKTTAVMAAGKENAFDIGSGSANEQGGSLSVGKPRDGASPLPVLLLMDHGTNSPSTFRNCTISGPGAGDLAGTYNAGGNRIDFDFAVVFDKNGGDTDAIPTTVEATFGGTVPIPAKAPIRAGYTFTGWNTRPDGAGNAFNESTKVTNDLTVYAQWTANTPVGKAPAISPDTVTYSFSNPGDVGVEVAFNRAKSVTGITRGPDFLTEHTDYAVNGSSLTILNHYLSGQGFAAGDSADFVVLFDTGDQVTLTVKMTGGNAPSKPHILTVKLGAGGSITSECAAGSVVSISAANESGYQFSSWISSGGGAFKERNSASTTFTMPDQDVTVTAEYKNTSGGSSGHHSSGGAKVFPVVLTDPATGVTVNISNTSFSSGRDEMTFSAARSQGTGLSADPRAAALAADTKLNLIGVPVLFNLKLLDRSGNTVSFTGSVTVQIPLPAGLRGTPRVFRYESNGTLTDMNAAVENGYLVFQTSHFSYYVIAGTGDSITLDTKDYSMPVGGKYQIGVKLTGTKAAAVKFHSTNDKVATVAKLKNGNYQVTGNGLGTAYIMFDVYDNKNKLLTHASVRVDVKTGIRPRGDSTRQIGVF